MTASLNTTIVLIEGGWKICEDFTSGGIDFQEKTTGFSVHTVGKYMYMILMTFVTGTNGTNMTQYDTAFWNVWCFYNFCLGESVYTIA